MIYHISINDFAIIENTEIDFDSGLSVITGETGSGKSIVVTAISLALGSRADSSYVRFGKDKATVELAGELDGTEYVLCREVSTQGRNVCRVNGRLVTLAELSGICSRLADIHGQYDNQSLLDPENHINVLDRSSSEISVIKSTYMKSYANYRKARGELNTLIAHEAENRRKLDFYRFEINEIDNASLKTGEDTDLEDRINLLKNSEKIFGHAEKAYAAVAGERGAYETLGDASSELEYIESFTSGLASASKEINDIYYRLEDVISDLRRILEDSTYSPHDLDIAIERLSLIDNLKKKYGSSIDEINAYRDRIVAELTEIENFDDELARLTDTSDQAKAALLKDGKALTEARLKAAEELQTRIITEMRDLNFRDAMLTAAVSPLPSPSENGLDSVEFLVSTNKGEPVKPLTKTASGGEISRIMLAIKKITAEYDLIPTLIFDEIDQGISGKTAAVVGRKLREISKTHQVICITHLPQIAAYADTAYRIYKDSDESSTYTHVDKLDRDSRIEELARLLGGETVTEAARENARELIEKARQPVSE